MVVLVLLRSSRRFDDERVVVVNLMRRRRRRPLKVAVMFVSSSSSLRLSIGLAWALESIAPFLRAAFAVSTSSRSRSSSGSGPFFDLEFNLRPAALLFLVLCAASRKIPCPSAAARGLWGRSQKALRVKFPPHRRLRLP